MLLSVLVSSALGGTSQKDYTIDDSPGSPTCPHDYCALYNQVEERQCADLFNAEAFGGQHWTLSTQCTGYYFIPADCIVDLNTGCTVQNSQSECYVECYHLRPQNIANQLPPWAKEWRNVW
jgi:hypothetical protein